MGYIVSKLRDNAIQVMQRAEEELDYFIVRMKLQLAYYSI